MKTVKMFLATVAMSLFCNVAVQAADPSLSLDFVFGEGNVEKTSTTLEDVKNDTDLEGAIINWRYPTNNFRLNLDFGFAQEDINGNDEDFYFGELNVGYALLESQTWELAPYLGYLLMDVADGIEVDGVMLGADLHWRMGSRLSVDAGAGYAMEPGIEISKKSLDDESIKTLRLKMNYHLNDSWAMGAGYRKYCLSGKSLEYDEDYNYDIFTVGATYTWGSNSETLSVPETEEQTEQTQESMPAVEVEQDSPAEEVSVETEPTVESEQQPMTDQEEQTEPLNETQEQSAVDSEITVEPEQENVEESEMADAAQPLSEPQEQAEAAPAPQTEEIDQLLKPVFFNFNSAEIREDQKVVLDQNIEVLKVNHNLDILVGGHTDSAGSSAYNVRLSQQRAQNVADYLVEKGIDAKRISIRAYGEEEANKEKEQNINWESDRWVGIRVSEAAPIEENVQ